MKTIELIEKVNHLGLETECRIHDVLINAKEGGIICSINSIQCFQLDMDWRVTELISDVIKEELFRIVCRYASTPIDEREIEPKYKLALRIVNNQVDEDNQLILFWYGKLKRFEVRKCCEVKGYIDFMIKNEGNHCKNICYIFTQKEWEEKLKTSWETITSNYQPIMIN